MRALLLTLMTCAIALPVHAQYSGGSGTADDPYQIATAADLIALGETSDDYDKHFILTADIDLDPNLPGGKVFDRAVIAPLDDGHSRVQDPFTGVLDGNGYRVLNLAISGVGPESCHSHIGLIGELGSGGQVRNLGVVDVRIVSSGWCVGGLAGRMKDALVTRCYSTGVVTGGSAVGGLIGRNGYEVGMMGDIRGGTIDQCYSTVSVSGNEAVGGLVGTHEGGSVACSYALGSVTGNRSIGGLVGWNGEPNDDTLRDAAAATVFHCYATGVVVGEDHTGGLIGGSGRNSWITASFWDIEASGLLKMCGFVDDTVCDDSYGKTTAEMQTASTFLEAGWEFVNYRETPQDYVWAEPEGGGYPVFWWQSSSLPSLPTFSGGTGEAADPYLISTVEELNSIGCNPRLMACHFKLVNDLDLAGVHFYPIGEGGSDIEDIYFPFYYPNLEWYRGTFDGNGHTIRHLTVDGGSCVGLFRCLAPGGEIRNLGVVDVNTSGSDGVGALVAWNGGTVTNCYSTGMISGDNDVGGLLGFNAGIVTRSHSAGIITGDNSVGGFVGSGTGSLTNCHSTAVVNATGSYVGGLAGQCGWLGSITTSFSTGPVTGGHGVGGLVGLNGNSDITMSYSTGSVSGEGSVGGLVGYNRGGSIASSYSTGGVSGGRDYVGGLVGKREVGDSVFSNFWDTQTSGQNKSACGTGLPTTAMKTASTFLEAGWDFIDETENGTDDIWWILEGQDYPRLWWEPRD